MQWINVPRGFEDVITVNGIVQPDIIKIEVDDIDSVLLPVKDDNLLITAKDGYTKVGETQFQPDSVLTAGPKSIISKMNKILTVVKSFENKSKDFSETVALETLNESIVTYSDTKVKISADIQAIGENVIHNLPIAVLQKPPGYNVEVKPSTLSITFKGGVDYIKNLKADDFTASVTFNRTWMKNEDYVVFVDVKGPEHVIEYEISPMEFTIAVR